MIHIKLRKPRHRNMNRQQRDSLQANLSDKGRTATKSFETWLDGLSGKAYQSALSGLIDIAVKASGSSKGLLLAQLLPDIEAAARQISRDVVAEAAGRKTYWPMQKELVELSRERLARKAACARKSRRGKPAAKWKVEAEGLISRAVKANLSNEDLIERLCARGVLENRDGEYWWPGDVDEGEKRVANTRRGLEAALSRLKDRYKSKKNFIHH